MGSCVPCGSGLLSTYLHTAQKHKSTDHRWGAHEGKGFLHFRDFLCVIVGQLCWGVAILFDRKLKKMLNPFARMVVIGCCYVFDPKDLETRQHLIRPEGCSARWF